MCAHVHTHTHAFKCLPSDKKCRSAETELLWLKLQPLALGGASLLEVLTTDDHCVRVVLDHSVVNLWWFLR